MSDSDERSENRGPKRPRALGRVGLWLSGAALIGSAALALWNRRALKSLRDAADQPASGRPRRDDDGIY